MTREQALRSLDAHRWAQTITRQRVASTGRTMGPVLFALACTAAAQLKAPPRGASGLRLRAAPERDARIQRPFSYYPEIVVRTGVSRNTLKGAFRRVDR